MWKSNDCVMSLIICSVLCLNFYLKNIYNTYIFKKYISIFLISLVTIAQDLPSLGCAMCFKYDSNFNEILVPKLYDITLNTLGSRQLNINVRNSSPLIDF